MSQNSDKIFSEVEDAPRRTWTFKADLHATAQATHNAKAQVSDENGIALENLTASVVHKENFADASERYRLIVVVERQSRKRWEAEQ